MNEITNKSAKIIGLFNHTPSYFERMKIQQLFESVRCSQNSDWLALQVADTLEYKVTYFDVPYCSERQAMALAYVIDGCQL